MAKTTIINGEIDKKNIVSGKRVRKQATDKKPIPTSSKVSTKAESKIKVGGEISKKNIISGKRHRAAKANVKYTSA